MSDITKEKLEKEIEKILKDADLSKTSTKKVIQALEKKLGVDLADKKKVIDQLVMDYVNSKESEEEKEEEEENDSEEEPKPKPKSKAKAKNSSDDDYDPSDEDNTVVVKVGKHEKVNKNMRVWAPKGSKVKVVRDSDSEEEEEEKPKKKGRKRKASDADSDEWGKKKASPKKATPKGKKIPIGALICNACWLQCWRLVPKIAPPVKGVKKAKTISFGCVMCNHSLTQTRRHDIPDGPQRDEIVAKISPREIPPGGLVCYACWVMACRLVQRRARANAGVAASDLSCCWCQMPLCRTRKRLLKAGEIRDYIASKIEPREAGGKGKNSGYTRAYKLSPELSELMGKEEMPRHEVVKRVWEIIKERQLYDPSNKQFAICDDDLFKVIGTKRFRTFGMMKYLKTHFLD